MTPNEAAAHEGPDAAGASEQGSLLSLDLGLFAVSAAVLTLEVLQFKIFAYSLDPVKIYLAVGVCLLGLGAAATLLSVLPRVGVARAGGFAAFFAALGGVLLVPAHIVFAKLAPTFSDTEGYGQILTLLALVVPYFCFGMTISLLLVSRAAAIGRAYAVNLGGSALGCILVFPLIELLGAERAVCLTGLAAIGGALLLHFPKRRAWQLSAGIAAALCVGATFFAPTLMPFPPDPQGQLAVVMAKIDELKQANPGAKIELVHDYGPKWDRTARVDVYHIESSLPELQSKIGSPIETRFFVQDSSAGSFLMGVGDDIERGKEFYEATLYGAGYRLGPRKKVLLIGLGGAPDVLTALHYGAERIEAVDINESTIDLIATGPYREFVGDPYADPAVHTHVMDGRTFLRSSSDKYDLIQMSGVDTKSVLASGSLSVNENYVYTREAIGEMLARIDDDGIVCFLRFRDSDAHVLTSVAREGLRDLGVEDWRNHVMVLKQGEFRAVLIRRTPFRPEQVETLHAWIDGREGAPAEVEVPTYGMIDVGFAHPIEMMYSPEPKPVATTDYFRAAVAGQLDAHLETLDRDLTSPTDDKPFFFYRDKLWQFVPEPFRPWLILNRPSFGIRSLLGMLGNLTLISAVLILLPLLILRGRGLRTPRAGRSLVYFSCLGMGFMLFEIGLMHRFVLLLGHQSYAITVVLLGLLVGASLGSSASSKLSVDTAGPVKAALLLLVAVIVVSAFVLGDVFNAAATLGFGARLGLALAILIGMGFLLGIPFPSALRALERISPPVVPWGIGINGFASVVGSTLAVPTAMVFGLRSLLFMAAGLYLLALLVAPLGRPDGPRAE